MRVTLRPHHAQDRAFTLVEMLVVMVIIGILATLVAPAMIGITMGNAVSRAGNLIEDNLNIARQRTMATQRETDVRFFNCRDPEDPSAAAAYRALQLFEVKDSGVKVPITPVIFLQHTMVMMGLGKSQYSSFLDGTLSPTEVANVTIPPIPGVTEAYAYREFGFRPAGDTTLPVKTANYFITVAAARDAALATGPKNFCTITFDPLTTKIFSFRP